jgi:hypothetical protein
MDRSEVVNKCSQIAAGRLQKCASMRYRSSLGSATSLEQGKGGAFMPTRALVWLAAAAALVIAALNGNGPWPPM